VTVQVPHAPPTTGASGVTHARPIRRGSLGSATFLPSRSLTRRPSQRRRCAATRSPQRAGHEGVRPYWTRQWAAIDPTVTPVAFTTRMDVEELANAE